jgi:hypothetical protein
MSRCLRFRPAFSSGVPVVAGTGAIQLTVQLAPLRRAALVRGPPPRRSTPKRGLQRPRHTPRGVGSADGWPHVTAGESGCGQRHRRSGGPRRIRREGTVALPERNGTGRSPAWSHGRRRPGRDRSRLSSATDSVCAREQDAPSESVDAVANRCGQPVQKSLIGRDPGVVQAASRLRPLARRRRRIARPPGVRMRLRNP